VLLAPRYQRDLGGDPHAARGGQSGGGTFPAYNFTIRLNRSGTSHGSTPRRHFDLVHSPWLAVLLVLEGMAMILSYVLYPLVIGFVGRRSPRGEGQPDSWPTLSVLIPAHNEASFIEAKLADVNAQHYPGAVQVIVVDDGSDDQTVSLAADAPSAPVVVSTGVRRGKCAALNDGVAIATGDVVVFTDASSALVQGSLMAIARPFMRAEVAVVGGRKSPQPVVAGDVGESAYWRYEAWLKARESLLGVVVGVDGGIYAVRRAQFKPFPDGIYADDYWVAVDALRRGVEVRHANDAVAIESVAPSRIGEFERRSRVSAGIWQVTLGHLRLLDCRRPAVAFAILCHRLLRTIVIPVVLPVSAMISVACVRRSKMAKLSVSAHGGVLMGAVIGARSRFLLARAVNQFVFMNAAALAGGIRHLSGSQSALWRKVDRGAWVDHTEPCKPHDQTTRTTNGRNDGRSDASQQ
jgi:poly-beta-1,6-N-acetyl-D-glucosamine synthase